MTAAIKILHAQELLQTSTEINEAIYMACGQLEDHVGKHAIQSVLDCLGSNLTKIHAMLDEVRGELE